MSNRIGKKNLFGLDGEIFENNSSIMQGESNGLFVEKKSVLAFRKRRICYINYGIGALN